jgi:hypothetical protein
VDYLSSIWVQPETPILRQENPNVPSKAPDDWQETPEDRQETPDDRQETSQVLQELDLKMSEYSWRDLSTDEEADEHLTDHFCKRGNMDKDPAKPGKPALFALLQKYMVAAGAIKIERFEDGIPEAVG